jgi:hypothetical protein
VSGAVKGNYTESGRGDEYQIGKTISYRRARNTLAGTAIHCKETTSAALSGQALTATKVASVCDGGIRGMLGTITIEIAGDSCNAALPSWSTSTCKVVAGRQLP